MLQCGRLAKTASHKAYQFKARQSFFAKIQTIRYAAAKNYAFYYVVESSVNHYFHCNNNDNIIAVSVTD